MSKRRGWTARAQAALTNLLELPQDAALDLPKVTLFGNLRLILENHRGILAYAPDCLQVATKLGVLEIAGQGLVLRQVRGESILVEGDIRGMSYHA